MKKVTLIFCIKNDNVLLGMKKRGFGAGKWNGYGGKLEENETPRTAMKRELRQESSLIVEENDLEQVAFIHFHFEEKHVFDCFVYITKKWQGEPVETEEMRPQWFPISDLPFSEMWEADGRWIPLILKGEKIEVFVRFNDDGSIVKEFNYKPSQFN